MDSFRTMVEVKPSARKITYSTPILFMGSCFSDAIGKKLTSLKFPVSYNPFGTLFNPASIADDIRLLMQNKPYPADLLHFHNGQWISFHHYTGFSHPDKDACLENINSRLATSSALLRQARFLFVTLGTALTYRFNETGRIVANCHKIPAAAFTRYLLSPDDITGTFDNLLTDLKVFNTELFVILSLSPVRYWKDGAVNNQKSKAILHYAIDCLLEKHPDVQYFPAYEIFMDELRDYRFYASDMLHPSESGSDYVFKRFTDAFMDEETTVLMKAIESLVKATGHRPVNPVDPAYKTFLQHTIDAMNRLSEQHPNIDFRDEVVALTKNMLP
jgi:hypothetical protein